jgi:hypothetical protein
VTSPASARGQNHLQPTRDAIRQFLGSGKDIGTGSPELRTPELSSIIHANQLQVQKQLVIALNYFSGDNGADEQLLAYCARVKGCVAAVLNCAVGQNPSS